jgi:hypothetical protein
MIYLSIISKNHFLKHPNILSNFSCLFLTETKSLDKVACKKLFEIYSLILHDDSPEIWISEVEIWWRLLVSKNIRNALDALDICNVDEFLNVHKMLRVMFCLWLKRLMKGHFQNYVGWKLTIINGWRSLKWTGIYIVYKRGH